NTFAFMHEIAASPGAYGFVNVTNPACTTPTGNTCNSSTLVAPNANMTYLFSDGHHGTTGIYLAWSSAMASMITGPQQIAALSDAPFAGEEANFRALDGRMWSALNTPGARSRFEAWAAYDYNHVDVNLGLTGDGNSHGNSVIVGADMKVTPQLLVGLM